MGVLCCNEEKDDVNADISRPPPREKPSVVIKQGTSFDEGVLKSSAKDMYEDVLKKA